MEYRTTEPVEDKSKTQLDSGNFSEGFPRILKIDEAKIQDHLGRMVRQSVEETLNGLLEAEADRLCQAGCYVRKGGMLCTQSGPCGHAGWALHADVAHEGRGGGVEDAEDSDASV